MLLLLLLVHLMLVQLREVDGLLHESLGVDFVEREETSLLGNVLDCKWLHKEGVNGSIVGWESRCRISGFWGIREQSTTKSEHVRDVGDGGGC